MNLPALVGRDEVQARLEEIFPEGSPHRARCTREITGAIVFVALYIGALEGSERYLGPKHVYRMSHDQAARMSDAERLAYSTESQKSGSVPLGRPWYADNTREQIRDEVLRQGLALVGAAIDYSGPLRIPTTSLKPRWCLAADFAALFDPGLVGSARTQQIESWRKKHLSAGALAKVAIYQAGAARDATGITVEFPNRQTRKLPAGNSSVITKQVIEEFAPHFLVEPAVLWLSDSKNHVVVQDELLAKRLRLNIDPGRNLPDIILADVGSEETILVFVEVVATDGPVTDARRASLLSIATEGGYDEQNVAFVTAFMGREHQAFRKSFASLAWNSFAWLASEPHNLVALLDFSTPNVGKLHELLAARRR